MNDTIAELREWRDEHLDEDEPHDAIHAIADSMADIPIDRIMTIPSSVSILKQRPKACRSCLSRWQEVINNIEKL